MDLIEKLKKDKDIYDMRISLAEATGKYDTFLVDCALSDYIEELLEFLNEGKKRPTQEGE